MTDIDRKLDLDRTLAAVAATQHGLITLADVRKAGGKNHHPRARIAAGRWEWVAHGVYRLAGIPWTYEARVLALVFAAGDGAVASCLCAARLLGIGFRTALPEVSIPRGRLHRSHDVRIHTSTDLDLCEIVRRSGIPITDPARTLLDVGRFVGTKALRKAVEEARRLELVTWHDLIVCLAAHARPGRHGVRRMREVIADGARNDEISDTDSELMALALLREYGFAEPTLQHRVYDDDGLLIAELDIAYVDDFVNFEIDGSVHLIPAVRRKDEARDHVLRQRGWTVRRIWWEIPVRQPDLFIQIVRETLREAAAKARP